MYIKDEENLVGSGLGFIDPITLGVGGSILAAAAPFATSIFGKKDTDAKDTAKIQRKMAQEQSFAMVAQAEQNKRLWGGAIVVGGAVFLTALLIWGSTRRKK